MKLIPLTKGYFTKVDDKDFEKFAIYRWHATIGTQGKIKARRNNFINGIRSYIYLHRAIMNVPKGLYTDHINHDTLDNRKKNLRICTFQQNCFNKIKHKDNTSGYKGVYWSKKENKWFSAIGFNRKLKNLGYYKTAKESAKVYNKKAKELFGKFAYLNKI